MKVKVHWVIDGIAEIEAETIEEAEKIINKKLSDFVNNNPEIEEKMGAKAIQGKGYLPGYEEDS
jgi:CRISPR/Cas system-associated protein Cas7 (RAMP superfamily)